MNTVRKEAAKQQNLRYWSSLTSNQKDKSSKMVCSILAGKYSRFIHPTLWKVLWDVSFTEIMDTKNMADKLCKGYCFNHNGVWIPLTIKDI